MPNISNINSISSFLNTNNIKNLQSNKDVANADFSKILDSFSKNDSGIDDKLMDSFAGSSKDIQLNNGNLPTNFLVNQINGLNDLHMQADNAQAEVAAGYGDPLQATLAVNKADMNFRLMMEVRNKAVGAFKEILRIQV